MDEFDIKFELLIYLPDLFGANDSIFCKIQTLELLLEPTEKSKKLSLEGKHQDWTKNADKSFTWIKPDLTPKGTTE